MRKILFQSVIFAFSLIHIIGFLCHRLRTYLICRECLDIECTSCKRSTLCHRHLYRKMCLGFDTKLLLIVRLKFWRSGSVLYPFIAIFLVSLCSRVVVPVRIPYTDQIDRVKFVFDRKI